MQGPRDGIDALFLRRISPKTFYKSLVGMKLDPMQGICLGIIALALWVYVDFRSWLRFLRAYHRLSHEGRFDEVEARFQREFRSFRPWVRLVLHVRAPGVLDLLYALYLQQRGVLDESLRAAERALAKAGGHTKMRG